MKETTIVEEYDKNGKLIKKTTTIIDKEDKYIPDYPNPYAPFKPYHSVPMTPWYSEGDGWTAEADAKIHKYIVRI